MSAYACHNCFEPLSYTGPTGRGDAEEAFAVRQGGTSTAILFCSEACARWWDGIIGFDGVGYASDIRLEGGEPVELP